MPLFSSKDLEGLTSREKDLSNLQWKSLKEILITDWWDIHSQVRPLSIGCLMTGILFILTLRWQKPKNSRNPLFMVWLLMEQFAELYVRKFWTMMKHFFSKLKLGSLGMSFPEKASIFWFGKLKTISSFMRPLFKAEEPRQPLVI